jgi:hypothetical protein
VYIICIASDCNNIHFITVAVYLYRQLRHNLNPYPFREIQGNGFQEIWYGNDTDREQGKACANASFSACSNLCDLLSKMHFMGHEGSGVDFID